MENFTLKKWLKKIIKVEIMKNEKKFGNVMFISNVLK
jgi:hypothetical protein